MSLSAYLPQDRVRALARGAPLPDRTAGSALFADISGFTPLTEALQNSLGSRRGTEQLTHYLDMVYTTLIAELEKQSGSVIGFAGDSIICWFDDAQGAAPSRAITCGLALQEAMNQFQHITLPDSTVPALGIKVSIATGPARRFIVGDPYIHYGDTLAGATITRMVSGE